jgi:NitT/TauT family transport system substrate-binding protein
MTGRSAFVRRLVLGLATAWLCLSGSAAQADQPLQKITWAFGDKAVLPYLVNWVIPQYLGYFRQEGLDVDFAPAGSNAPVIAGLKAGRFQIGPGLAAFQLPMLARGENLPYVDFFEYTYPFKFGMAVKEGSAIESFAQFKGKKIGLHSFGTAEYPIAQELVRRAGLDPEKDVSWISVGEGLTGGLMLQRGDIDGLMYYDTGFGQIEAAGIKLKYLTFPPDFPKIGGAFLATTPDILKHHPAWAVGIGRAMLKASLFTLTNPEAATYIFLKMYPEAAPKGMSIQDAVKAVMVPVTKRMPLFAPYDKSVKWGYMKKSDWEDEVDFAGLRGKITDAQLATLYTNALIDQINDFDHAKIVRQARDFELPYKR